MRDRPPIPTWVKAGAAAALALVVVFVLLHLSGANPFGGHGP